MDLHTVTELRRATHRGELHDAGVGTALLAGGTWLFGQPQDHLHTVVDLTGLGWPSLSVSGDGLVIGATCTLAELAAFEPRSGWTAGPLLEQCCSALAGSFKIGNVATVGGNLCVSLPAGPMTSLAAAIDGVAVVWTRDGRGERRVPVAGFVIGDRRNVLGPGEVLRAVELPGYALRARTAFRRAALSPEGRSASVVIGRRDADATFVLTITAATERPYRFAFPRVPRAAELAAALDSVPRWFDDPHGAPDWRRSVTGLLAEEIRAELS